MRCGNYIVKLSVFGTNRTVRNEGYPVMRGLTIFGFRIGLDTIVIYKQNFQQTAYNSYFFVDLYGLARS